ncbi:hypothetical protein AB1Y20_021139 [Prymnesium parvum]|uniref:Uncharacterized protein n=1 Tax=Prymnesium parvum TaxID=97485 RepID=A0AB34JKQ3_PRYPA
MVRVDRSLIREIERPPAPLPPTTRLPHPIATPHRPLAATGSPAALIPSGSLEPVRGKRCGLLSASAQRSAGLDVIESMRTLVLAPQPLLESEAQQQEARVSHATDLVIAHEDDEAPQSELHLMVPSARPDAALLPRAKAAVHTYLTEVMALMADGRRLPPALDETEAQSVLEGERGASRLESPGSTRTVSGGSGGGAVDVAGQGAGAAGIECSVHVGIAGDVAAGHSGVDRGDAPANALPAGEGGAAVSCAAMEVTAAAFDSALFDAAMTEGSTNSIGTQAPPPDSSPHRQPSTPERSDDGRLRADSSSRVSFALPQAESPSMPMPRYNPHGHRTPTSFSEAEGEEDWAASVRQVEEQVARHLREKEGLDLHLETVAVPRLPAARRGARAADPSSAKGGGRGSEGGGDRRKPRVPSPSFSQEAASPSTLLPLRSTAATQEHTAKSLELMASLRAAVDLALSLHAENGADACADFYRLSAELHALHRAAHTSPLEAELDEQIQAEAEEAARLRRRLEKVEGAFRLGASPSAREQRHMAPSHSAPLAPPRQQLERTAAPPAAEPLEPAAATARPYEAPQAWPPPRVPPRVLHGEAVHAMPLDLGGVTPDNNALPYTLSTPARVPPTAAAPDARGAAPRSVGAAARTYRPRGVATGRRVAKGAVVPMTSDEAGGVRSLDYRSVQSEVHALMEGARAILNAHAPRAPPVLDVRRKAAQALREAAPLAVGPWPAAAAATAAAAAAPTDARGGAGGEGGEAQAQTEEARGGGAAAAAAAGDERADAGAEASEEARAGGDGDEGAGEGGDGDERAGGDGDGHEAAGAEGDGDEKDGSEGAGADVKAHEGESGGEFVATAAPAPPPPPPPSEKHRAIAPAPLPSALPPRRADAADLEEPERGALASGASAPAAFNFGRDDRRSNALSVSSVVAQQRAAAVELQKEWLRLEKEREREAEAALLLEAQRREEAEQRALMDELQRERRELEALRAQQVQPVRGRIAALRAMLQSRVRARQLIAARIAAEERALNVAHAEALAKRRAEERLMKQAREAKPQSRVLPSIVEPYYGDHMYGAADHTKVPIGDDAGSLTDLVCRLLLEEISPGDAMAQQARTLNPPNCSPGGGGWFFSFTAPPSLAQERGGDEDLENADASLANIPTAAQPAPPSDAECRGIAPSAASSASRRPSVSRGAEPSAARGSTPGGGDAAAVPAASAPDLGALDKLLQACCDHHTGTVSLH